jgi:sugar lactone lactonase YvrE
MLFRKHIVSTRTLFQLAVALVFFVAAVGAAVAANSGNAPLLVPYVVNTVAGNPQFTSTGTVISGYGGDGNLGTPTIATPVLSPMPTLTAPLAVAVDSVGNVYFTDSGNDLIREVNYQTGNINIVAGVAPHGCSGVICSPSGGCADGVQAYGAKIGGSVTGIAVDAYGNVFFTDNKSSTVSVIYRGGTRVAQFISLVNPAAVALSNGVQVGYVYHIAGEISLGSPLNTTAASCTGLTSVSGTIIDNAPAFENTDTPGAIPGATLHNPANISLDSAGNIYVADVGNQTVRVINTQTTKQTFFQYTVQPGYMRSITNCNSALTANCAGLTTMEVGTGINGPVNALYFSAQWESGEADAYGNIYQMNGTGASTGVPGVYAPAAYAGGAPLTNLLTVEAPSLSPVYGPAETTYPVPASDTATPNELPLTYGNSYISIGNPSLTSTLPGNFPNVLATTNEELDVRASYLIPDAFGTFWYFDWHYPELERIDQYTSDSTGVIGNNAHMRALASVTGLGNAVVNSNGTISNYSEPASLTPLNPWNCVYGTTTTVYTFGPQTYDPVGDGCPAILATLSGSASSYNLASDGLGNVYYPDSPNDIIREFTVGDTFPATAVAPAGVSAWSSTTAYALNSVVSYTPCTLASCPLGAYYVSLVASNTGNKPSNATKWKRVSVTQPIQVHFDATNIPVTGGAVFAKAAADGSTSSVQILDGPSVGYTTNAFTITGSGDFAIDMSDQEFPMGSIINSGATAFSQTTTTANFALYPVAGAVGLPTCTQLGLSSPDTSWDCLVYVTFSPTQPGLREGTLVVNTANGASYSFPLTGVGTGGQLAIDGGLQQAVATSAANGLGTISSIAMTSTTGYIADPTNNRIVAITISNGTQTAIGPSISVTSPVFGQGSTGVVQTLSNPMGVAVDAAGNVYIADTGNNRILKYNPITATATVLGNYLWVPGSACDGGSGTTTDVTNCVFTGYTTNTTAGSQSQSIISGSNSTGKFTAEPGASVTSTTAPPQYAFKAPQGLAVDAWGNVYVADTGNAAIVEIPSNTALGGAVQLFQYPGAPTFTNPVAVAVGPGPVAVGSTQNLSGYIYVADTGNPANEIVRIPPGGGDLQAAGTTTPGSALTVATSLPLFGGQGITSPNGVAVDAAGNVYVSDSTGNAVWEAPAQPTRAPFMLTFTGLSSPAGLALDANGNVYVADSGNKQVLEMNRQNPNVPFGTVPQDLTSAVQPLCANTTYNDGDNIGNLNGNCVLTVTNIGNAAVTLAAPFLGTVSNSQFSVTTPGSLTTCVSPLPAGTTCTISPLFIPTSDGATTGSFTVNGSQSVAMLAGIGANPEVKIVLTPSNGTLATGSTTNYNSATGAETITATVTQLHTPPGGTPTGTVTFNYTIAPTGPAADGGVSCGSPGSATVALNASGVATYAMPALTTGLIYTVSATYNGDGSDSGTAAIPILLTVPGTPGVTVATTSVSYTYGQVVPAITGTVTPTPPTGVTYIFVGLSITGVPASQYSNVGTYPIEVVFSGTGANAAIACAYGQPPTGATVTEKQAPLTVTIPAYTTVYGAATFNYATGMVITGAVRNSDLKALSATFSPANSQILDVIPGSPYTVTATMTGKPIGNYIINNNKLPTGTDTVTAAPAGIAVTAASTAVANTTAGLASATYGISVGSLVPAGYGMPTGTVSVTDYFVPITSTVFIVTPTTGVFPTVNGAIAWPTGTITIPPCATGQTSTAAVPCNSVVTLNSAGGGTFTLPATEATTIGTHYLSFAYSGDPIPAVSGGTDGKGDFACSVVGQTATASCATTSAVPFALIVDNPDFTLTSTTGPVSILPGVVPSGNGLPAAPNQNTAATESAVLTINGVLSFAGTLNLSCATQHPTYVFCAVQQFLPNGTEVQNVTVPCVAPACPTSSSTVPFVLSVWTPVTLPLGFNTSQMRTTATRTVLAFLPFGVLAFCVRRRRRLSKALWMLIAIAAVSAGMSGCGGNQVDFYTAIPTGPQTVTVTVKYTYVSTAPLQPAVSRSFVVPITIN